MEKDCITFKKYKAKDAPCLSRVRQKCWQETYCGIYPPEEIFNFDFEKHRQKFLEYIAKCCECYKILHEGEIIGYFIFGLSLREGVKEARLNSLYILKEYQKRGAGRRAFEILKAFCIKNNLIEISAECNYHNKNALAFYAKMGFTITEEDIGNDSKQQDQLSLLLKL